MTLRRTCALALALVIAVLSACTADTPPPKPPVDGADSGGRLLLWAPGGLEVQATLLADAYNATHTNQVELSLVPAADYAGRLEAAAGTGALPDLFAGTVADVPGWTGKGFYQDVTGRIDRLPFAAAINPAHVRAGTAGDRKHVLPFVVDKAGGGDAIGISRDSKKADQAWNFLYWLMSDEAQVHVLGRNGDAVARSDLPAAP